MYGIVRTIIGIIIFSICKLVLEKYEALDKKKCNTISVLIAIFGAFVLAFLPFENAIISFSTSEEAYHYYNPGDKVQQIIEGEESDFIIGGYNGKQNILIIPKSTEGWKIGISIDTRLVEEIYFENTFVYIYQYRKTQDYFCMVVSAREENVTISDSQGSAYISEEYSWEANDKIIHCYSAYVNGDLIMVDGREILLKRKE